MGDHRRTGGILHDLQALRNSQDLDREAWLGDNLYKLWNRLKRREDNGALHEGEQDEAHNHRDRQPDCRLEPQRRLIAIHPHEQRHDHVTGNDDRPDNPFRLTLRDVENLKTRNNSGDMVPIGSVATFRDTTGPFRVPRYNLYPAAEVQLNLTRGFSTGQAIAAVEGINKERLPPGFGFEWTEIALQEKLAGNTAILAFGLAVVFVFLLLSALYESWLLPLAVVLIVPMCILAAMIGVNVRGLDRNILVEIGLVVLVGLAAKNAILIVEFAKQAEEEGKTRIEAAELAAQTRLRPIIMTSLAFILGVVPLMVAAGAGAEMRQSLGTAVFAGMLGVTLFGLLFTPVFYVLVRRVGFDRRERVAGAPVTRPVYPRAPEPVSAPLPDEGRTKPR
jgi:AcrB/AcrD/AcrF family